MGTNLGHDDVTVTLDELFANNTVAQLLPQDELLKCWRRISEASAKNINARGAFYMLQTQQPAHIRQKSFGTSPGAQFPEPTNSKYTTMNLSAIVDESTLQWDGNVDDQNQAALKQKPAKSLDYVERELEGAYAHYARQHARQLWGDASNELARVSAINTGTRTVTCNNAGNLFNVQLLEQGMLIEIRDSTGATIRGYFRIESIYRPTKTFIIDANYIHDGTDTTAALAGLGVANNDRIYPKFGYNNAWKGVDYMIATSGAFQSLADRTIHDHLTGVSIDGSARAISAALMRRLRSARRNRRYGKKSKGKFYASTQIDGYEATAFATQKYGQTTSLDMGYTEDELKFDGKSFEWDYYIAKTKVYETDLSAIDRFELREFKPLKKNGSYIHLAPGVDRHYDKENIYLKGVGQLGCEVPAAVGGVLTNLSTAGLALGDD
jgi:hypothetical protein